jgi:glucose-6-phosphate 1-dehydrogenase
MLPVRQSTFKALEVSIKTKRHGDPFHLRIGKSTATLRQQNYLVYQATG